jgi:hypothetical protein
VLVHDLESMLLRDPPQNRFSTVSALSGLGQASACLSAFGAKRTCTTSG